MSDLFGFKSERRWYVLQTATGSEEKVRADLERRIESLHMEDQIFQVLVPKHKIEVKKASGAKVSKEVKLFPCYVFVEMCMDERSWYVVRHTPGVSAFVGSGNHPLPMQPEEVDRLMEALGNKKEPEKVVSQFAVGDRIRVTIGVFKDSVGFVSSVDAEKQKVKFDTEFLGRSTTVEADFSEIEKL